MFDGRLNESRFYQADNGEWFEVRSCDQLDRVQTAPTFMKVADDASLTFRPVGSLHAAKIDRNGRFACMEGICEMGGAGTGDRSGRFACMEGICEMSGTAPTDRSGRFGCMEGICES